MGNNALKSILKVYLGNKKINQIRLRPLSYLTLLTGNNVLFINESKRYKHAAALNRLRNHSRITHCFNLTSVSEETSKVRERDI